jgi:hypothetical protein
VTEWVGGVKVGMGGAPLCCIEYRRPEKKDFSCCHSSLQVQKRRTVQLQALCSRPDLQDSTELVGVVKTQSLVAGDVFDDMA